MLRSLTPVIGIISLDASRRRVTDALLSDGTAGVRFLGTADEIAAATLDELHVLFTVGGTAMAASAASVARAARDRAVLCLVMAMSAPDGLTTRQADESAVRLVGGQTDVMFPLCSRSEPSAEVLAADVIRDIADTLTRPGRIQFDYADLYALLKDRGEGRIATGWASGVDRARRAARRLLRSPLLLGRNWGDFAAGLLIARIVPEVTIDELYGGFAILGYGSDDGRIWAWQGLPAASGRVEIQLTGILAGARDRW